MKRAMKKNVIKRLLLVSICVLLVYIGTYLYFRNTHIELWSKDGHSYVIFPSDNPFLYYYFRPLTYIDGLLTGMKFHKGSHQE